MKARTAWIAATPTLIVITFLCLWYGAPRRSDSSGPVGGGPRLSHLFPVGEERTYELSWTRNDRAAMPIAGEAGASVTSRVELEAVLYLRSLGPIGERTLVSLSLASFRKLSIEVMGERLDSPPLELAGEVAYLEIDRRGRACAIRFEADTNDVFRHLVTSLSAELDLELPAGEATWAGPGPGSFGAAMVEFTWQTTGRLHRRRLSYEGHPTASIESRAALEVDARGLLLELDASEVVELAGGSEPAKSGRVETSLHFVKSGTFVPPLSADAIVAATSAQPVGEARAGHSADKKLLDQRVGDLTKERMLAELATLARIGDIANQQRFLWQATGLLRRDPALAASIPPLFEQASFSRRARGFAVDLLVLSDTAEAQRALLDIMARPAVHSDSETYLDYLQRMAALRTPTAEAIAHVEAALPAAGRPGQAAAYTLGAMAHALAAGGRDTEARRLVARIARALAEATDSDLRASHIGALGNAGRPELVPEVARQGRDPSPLIRAAAARALRKTHGADARRALLALAADADTHVQGAALASLSDHPVVEEDLRTLLAAMQSGHLHRKNDAALLPLLAEHGHSQSARVMLDLVMARNPDDSELRLRARELLRLFDAGG